MRESIICQDHDMCNAAKSLQSYMTLCNPIDSSPPGSPVPGILQARTLEWVAISFSKAWKRKVKVKSFSRVWLLATPWSIAYQAPPSMGLFRQEYWSGVPFPSPDMCNGGDQKVVLPCHITYCPWPLSPCSLLYDALSLVLHPDEFIHSSGIKYPYQMSLLEQLIKPCNFVWLFDNRSVFSWSHVYLHLWIFDKCQFSPN